MRWALPFIAAAITFGLGLVGAPHVPAYGTVPIRQQVTLRLPMLPAGGGACGLGLGPASAAAATWQAAAGARWDAASLWSGVLLGTPDNPLAAAWRGFVNYTKGRDAPVVGRPGCRPDLLAGR